MRYLYKHGPEVVICPMSDLLLCRHIKTVIEGRPHKLLESVAERLANEILNDYHQVQGLQLHIKKPHVAVTGVLESLGKSKTSLGPILMWKAVSHACEEGAMNIAALFRH